MIVEIIHMSDFHIKSKFDAKKVVESIQNSILFRDKKIYSTIILCITGDIAFSGQQKQYELFSDFLNEFNKMIICNKFKLKIMIVPGNHDINLDAYPNRMNIIRNALDSGDIDSLLKDDLQRMNAFFKFAKKYGLFIDNKHLFQETISVGDKKININLFNTAIFSSLRKDDKDMHYIPNEAFFDCKNCGDFNISLLHHSDEWLDESCQNNMDAFLNECDFYLYGHQHKSDMVMKEEKLCFLCNEFDVNNLQNSSFDIILLNIDDRHLHKYKVTYNALEDKFVRNSEERLIVLHQKNNKRNMLHKYKDELSFITIEQEKFNIDEIFVMPLINDFNENNKEILDFDELLKIIEGNGIIFFEGGRTGGKTTLLKKIYCHYLYKNKYVLWMDSIEHITNNSAKSIKKLFEINYSQEQYDSFIQSEKKEKLIIIDYDLIYMKEEKIKKFLSEISNTFGKIIISSSDNIADIKQKIKVDIYKEAKILSIYPFTKKQRDQLIYNLCLLKKIENDYDEVVKCIDYAVQNNGIVDVTSPDILCLLIFSAIKNKFYKEKNTRNAFSMAFEVSIGESLKDYFDDEMEDASIILREVAYFIFKNKDDFSISCSEMSKVLSFCREKWGININFNEIIKYFDNSYLLRMKEDGNYQFSKSAYFSYFVGKKISVDIQMGTSYDDDLKNLTDNIIVGYNGNILLFIAYFSASHVIFNWIIDKINELTKDYKMLSFEKNNHYILHRRQYEQLELDNFYEGEEEHRKRIDLQERKIIKEKENSNSDLVDKEILENPRIKSLMMAIKLNEILSKAVNGYDGTLDLNQRQKMLEVIYITTYKCLFEIFNFDEESYKDFYDYCEGKLRKIKEKDAVKIVTSALYDFMSVFCLNIITNFASMFVSKKSIVCVSKIEDKNFDNIDFDRFMFKLICYERYGNEDLFVEYLLENINQISSVDRKNIVRKIFNLFVITSYISSSNLEKCCSALDLSKEKVLLLKARSDRKLIKLK